MKTLASFYSKVKSYVTDFYEFNTPIVSLHAKNRVAFNGKITGGRW